MPCEKISELQPQKLWENFENICSIPHPSTKTEKIADYMKAFGEQLGLKTQVDEGGNVIIKKPASSGMEDRKAIILQGHLDMVPQKNDGVEHDFANDPIQAYIDGEWITAKGTTLGADNGIGEAAIMAILQANDLRHGPITALLTNDEEIGMLGAFKLEKDSVEGDILLNLDVDTEGEFYIGCAGIVYTDAKMNYSAKPISQEEKAFKITVSGLKGGHSGADIHLGRGNAIKLLARILSEITLSQKVRVANLTGGAEVHNAIPREAHAVVAVSPLKEAVLSEAIKTLREQIKKELNSVEPDLVIEIIPTELPGDLIDEETQEKLIKSLYGCPNGVIRMSSDIPDLVETSSTLSYLKAENGSVEIYTSQRSSIDSARDDAGKMICCIFELTGASVTQSSRCPGWSPNINANIIKLAQETYKKLFGNDPEVKAVHAGLECGRLGEIFPQMEMISFGPTIQCAHSPDEKVNIASVQKFWDFLVALLKVV